MFTYPQYEEDGEEALFFPNSWRDYRPQPLVGVDCFTPFADINNLQNRFVWEGTGLEFRQIFSALLLGAEFAYPQSYLQVVANFLRMVHCPIDFEEECQEFPPYAGLISYPLQNPFSNPNFVPDGYLIPPFIVVDDDNIDEFPQNELGDVVVPAGAITLDVNWFDDISGQLPTILVKVQGSGKLSINLLNQALGGLAVVTVDNPPDLADIIIGVVTGADNIIDLNLDLISLPPETAVEHVFPIDIVGEGLHTIYIVFLPILDDALVPIRFGGGFRGVELCDFGELPDMGITNMRVVPNFELGRYDLEKQLGGEWSLVDGWDTAYADWDTLWDRGVHGETVAIALHDIEDFGEPYPNDGFVGSPLQDYIDSAATPFDPSELEAAIATAQATADTALESAGDANATNITQQAVLDDHEERISELENDFASLTNTVWSQEYDFLVSDGGWSHGSMTWTFGQGFLFDGSNGNQINKGLQIFDYRVNWLELHIRRFGTQTGFIFPDVEWPAGLNAQEIRIHPYTDGTIVVWVQIKENSLGSTTNLVISTIASNSWWLEKLVIWGRGDNPF